MQPIQTLPVDSFRNSMKKGLKLERKPELDALRGFFLVWMTISHLPTRLHNFVNQPLGFVTSAEGFVCLSALLAARLYIRKAAADPHALRVKLWKRSLRLYTYHVALLVFLFTAVAAYAVSAHNGTILTILAFYRDHPLTAIGGSLLLIYCPRLMDILPMYILYLLATPYILTFAARRGWSAILAASGILWLVAQFGLRLWIHDLVVRITHLQVPLEQTGAFNVYAWQAIWVLGLWLGAESAGPGLPFHRLPRLAFPTAAVVCLFFVCVRYGWLGPALSMTALHMPLDKYYVGWLRAINLGAFSMVLYWHRAALKRLLLVEPFLTLGKASLHVFCAHVVFVFIAFGLLQTEIERLPGRYAIPVFVFTFAGLILVAYNEARRKRVHAPTTSQQPV